MKTHTAKDLEIDVPDSLVKLLIRSGQIHPTKTGHDLTYSLQDLIVLGIASGMRAAKIAPRTIVVALTKIRAALPAAAGMDALPVTPRKKATHNASSNPSEPAPDQQVLPLIMDNRPASVTTLKRRAAAERRRLEAELHFKNAFEMEEADVAAARAGYIAALDAHGGHLEARINLGRLLHLNGELAEAEKVYREAKHASAMLSYNLAILLEDLDREEEAVLSYREALALDPALHDAHFNLSRLHENAKRPREALHHLLAYRRHTR